MKKGWKAGLWGKVEEEMDMKRRGEMMIEGGVEEVEEGM